MQRRYLFIHQNFPAQFLHVAQELARRGHEVVALAVRGRPLPGVRFIRYQPQAPQQASAVPLAQDFEIKVIRGSACAAVMEGLRGQGFQPDVVVAHPGWGEALFCKDVWPRARLVVYAEFFYQAEGSDYGFDAERFQDSLAARCRLTLKNTALLHALSAADAVYAPTEWQRSRLPPEYQGKCQVMFDGIDTQAVRPDPLARITLGRSGASFAPGDELLTFVNRNLEPYRGFHVFMRALPRILARRPNANCLIVGRDSVSYGSPPPGGGTWREAMLRELGGALPMDRVHFLGGLPYADYLRVLQVSACHVYMSYPFVLSWSCLEAMSAGCLLVGSRTPPVQEVIEDGVNGRLFDFFDVDALVERVVECLEAPAGFTALRHAARDTVVRRYDLQGQGLPGQLRIIDPLA